MNNFTIEQKKKKSTPVSLTTEKKVKIFFNENKLLFLKLLK